MKRILTLLSIIALVVIMTSCGQDKPEPVEMGDMKTYTDADTKFEVQYPGNWYVLENPGEFFWVYSDSIAKRRFGKYDAEGFPGARILVTVKTLDTAANKFENIIKVFGSDRFGGEFYTANGEEITVGGVKGLKYEYGFPRYDGEFKGMTVIATPDSVTATILQLEAFADAYDNLYKAQFDKILSTFKIAQTIVKSDSVVFVETENDPPTMNLANVRGDGFVLGIPDNFYKNNSAPKAPSAEKSYFYWGDRRGDSFIRVDIFDASKQKDLNKIADENKAAYGNSTPKDAKVDGKSAKRFDYKASPTVKGRVYFVVNGEKLYRITTNWFVDEEADFLPPFEKSVNSFKFQ